MKFDTDYPADSVEFCPAQGLEDYFVCGTYKLVENVAPHEIQETDDSGDSPVHHAPESSRKRIGKCILFKVQEEEDEAELQVLQELELPAILDMKWSPSSSLLAIADSEGHISLQKLELNSRFQEVQSIQCRSVETLCLSLDWSNRRNPDEAGSIAVSSSDGSLTIIRPDSSGAYAETETWHGHDYEPWAIAWDYWDTKVLYSGGDDLKLKGWDIRQGFSSPTFTNKKFDAGVTSIHSHPYNERVLAVGSYDATVRIFDTRKPLVPVAQAEVGGGAWRAKWHPNPARSTDLLVACMHGGFKIVRFAPSVLAPGAATHDAEHGWDIIKRFDSHESLAYGVDWSYKRTESIDDTLIASCSFYDHALYTWRG